jgi:hypothetical protein
MLQMKNFIFEYNILQNFFNVQLSIIVFRLWSVERKHLTECASFAVLSIFVSLLYGFVIQVGDKTVDDDEESSLDDSSDVGTCTDSNDISDDRDDDDDVDEYVDAGEDVEDTGERQLWINERRHSGDGEVRIDILKCRCWEYA